MKYLFHELTVRYSKCRKTILIMRLTAILLLIACLHAGAKGFSQTVTLSATNMPLEKVCREIERQTGYYFVYANNLNNETHLVSLDVTRASVGETLDRVFAGLPFFYKLIGKVVVVNTVNPKQRDAGDYLGTNPSIEIKGRITNIHGEPLAGASIVCKKNGRGTETNANGEFKLKGLNIEDEITISYTGFKPLKIKIGNRINFTLILDETNDELDKAVVQAYGTTSRRFATGNIATVTADEIAKQPIVNPLMALQGRVAGLEITQINGYASSPIRVNLRGINSLTPGIFSDPLYIIDGVPLTILQINANLGYTLNSTSSGFTQNNLLGPAGGQNPFFSLNPNDIESIEVLKDADATSIYGSRAANGAILITTKKGKAGKTQFSMNASQGLSVVTRHWSMLNTRQYLQMRREAFNNDGVTPTANNAPDLLLWDTTRYTDWQKFLWGNTGKWTDVQAGLTGGNAQTTFRIGAGYNRTTDITATSGANQRGSISFSLNHRTLDQRFTISFTSSYSFSEMNMINIGGAVTLPPNAPAVFDKNGHLNYAQWSTLKASYPFANLLQPYDSKTNFINSNILLNVVVCKGLSAKASFGYNNGQVNQTSFLPISSLDPTNTKNTGTANFGNNHSNNWIAEPQVEYNGFIGKGKINVLIGGTIQSTLTEGIFIQGRGYTNDELLGTITNAPTKTATANYGQYRYAAIFGRINYNWNAKYILSLNARRDGSSRFGPGKQFGNFGSIGGAWLFTEERWIKDHLPSVLSFGKLRGSYGITGNDGVADYSYLSQWNANGLVTYDGISPLAPTINANPNYHWEVNKKLEGAIDIGLIKDRINLQVTYYRNRCNNQLVPLPTPLFSGFSNVSAINWPANVQNSGWEFSLNARIVDHKNFSWTMNFNTGINKNKLIAYPNLAQSPYANQYKIGEPLNQAYVLHYTGVNQQTGQYAFQDLSHDGVITINTYTTPGTRNDDRYRVNLVPKYLAGFGNSFRYKDWNLAFFIYIKNQIGRNALYNGNGWPGGMSNQSVLVLSRWQKTGDIASLARFTTNPGTSFSNFGQSDGVFTDASYVRLSNLSISYSLPEKILKNTGMKGFHFVISGQNLLVFTRYKGVDPEVQNFGSMPQAKTITGGLSFSF